MARQPFDPSQPYNVGESGYRQPGDPALRRQQQPRRGGFPWLLAIGAFVLIVALSFTVANLL